MIQENIINIDIVNEEVVNFSKFLQQEFSSEINVTDIFGIKFETNEPVKINIFKPLYVAKEEDSEELYTCKYCNKSFSRVYHLNRHKQNVHSEISEEDPLFCNECNKSFKSRRGYTQHMFQVHRDKDKVHRCHLCDYTTKYQKKLDVHVVKHNSSSPSPEQTYLCVECGKIFKTKDILRKHQKEVHYGVEVCCNLCDYKTKRRRDLVTHKKNCHSEDGVKFERPDLTCEVCGFRTKYKQTLDDHCEREHLQLSYSCSICDFVTNRKRKLQEHKERHGKVHQCQICQKIFSTMKKFRKHKNETHRVKIRSNCRFCNYSSTSAKMFLKHLKNKHGVEQSESHPTLIVD